MEFGKLTPDTIRLISTYLAPKDIISLGKCCTAFREHFLRNQQFWMYYVVSKVKLSLDKLCKEDIDWQNLAFQSQCKVNAMIKYHKLLYRLHVPRSSRDWLGIFCRIETKGQRQVHVFGSQEPTIRNISLPPIGLSCDVNNIELNHLYYGEEEYRSIVVFHMKSTTNPTFLRWDGEGGVSSEVYYYAVDRQKSAGKNKVDFNKDELSIKMSLTLMSRGQYKKVGKILYQDENYFNTSHSMSYNNADGHGRMKRLGTSAGGFATNSKVYNLPNLRISACKGLTITMSLKKACELFLKNEN